MILIDDSYGCQIAHFYISDSILAQETYYSLKWPQSITDYNQCDMISLDHIVLSNNKYLFLKLKSC